MPSIKDPRLRRFDRVFALCLFFSFLAYFGLTVFREMWYGDFPFYLSAVSALQTSFWDPGHETVAGAGLQNAFLYSPYIFSVALLGKAFSLSPFATLQLASILNLIFYIGAIVHFFRVFSVNRECWAAPALFLLVSLTVRRFNFGWSSETSLLTLRWIQAYPSTFAWSVVIVSLAEAELFLRNARSRHLVSVLVGLWFLLISHMLSASWLFGLLALRLMFRRVLPTRDDLGKSWRLAAAIAFSFAATGFWPYLDVLKILTLAGHPENPPFGQNLISETWYPFLLGVPPLLYFNYRKQHRLLFLWFAGTWFAYFCSKMLGLSFGNRYLFFQQFFLHVTIAEILTLGLKSVFTRHTKRLDPWLLTIVCVCFAGILASPQLRGAFRGPDQLMSPLELIHSPANRQVFSEKWTPYRPYIDSNDIVLTPLHDAAPAYLATYTGCRSIIGVYVIEDNEEREFATSQFLNPDIPWQDKMWVLDKYHVSKVLVPRDQDPLFDQMEEHMGPPIYRGEDYAVFSVGTVEKVEPGN